jgi:hypothetical protein
VAVHRGPGETEAESVAHIVCAPLGLDTAAYSHANVLDWAAGDIGLVKQTADTVLRVAKAILRDLPGDPDVESGDTDLATPAEPAIAGVRGPPRRATCRSSSVDTRTAACQPGVQAAAPEGGCGVPDSVPVRAFHGWRAC